MFIAITILYLTLVPLVSSGILVTAELIVSDWRVNRVADIRNFIKVHTVTFLTTVQCCSGWNPSYLVIEFCFEIYVVLILVPFQREIHVHNFTDVAKF